MIGLVEKQYPVDEVSQELITKVLQGAKLPQDLKSLAGAVILIDYEPYPYWE